MRKLLLALLVALLPAFSASLPDAERAVLTGHLEKSSREFLSAVEGLSEQQWNYKPAPDRWSIAECAEHIALSEGFLREIVEKNVLTAEPTPGKIAGRKGNDEKILPMVTDRSFKAKAPEPIAPRKEFASTQATLDHFQQSRAKTLQLANTRDDLREHAAKHPAFEELDAYQWLLYLSGHTSRHTAQIQEVKATPGFPK